MAPPVILSIIPGKTVILEARAELGGTWGLFNAGRSDSDSMYARLFF
jgi:cation diffusion facilitator CzcD-associated flavoprotein CzcO